jgi:hypothetical protein
MSDRSTREELISWPDPLPESEAGGDDWERAEDPTIALARVEAALVAARNEIALLRARTARLQRDNERLESDLAERNARKPR